jgi:hypothetical protein
VQTVEQHLESEHAVAADAPDNAPEAGIAGWETAWIDLGGEG